MLAQFMAPQSTASSANSCLFAEAEYPGTRRSLNHFSTTRFLPRRAHPASPPSWTWQQTIKRPPRQGPYGLAETRSSVGYRYSMIADVSANLASCSVMWPSIIGPCNPSMGMPSMWLWKRGSQGGFCCHVQFRGDNPRTRRNLRSSSWCVGTIPLAELSE